MTTTTKKLPIKMIDIVRSNTWTGLTIAELFHAGRLGSNGSDKRNIELLAAQLYEPQDLEEYKELMKLANEAYEYLLTE
jgi:hypothetical protein